MNHTNNKKLRIIKTARTEEDMNKAVLKGYWPLVKRVVPSPDIKSPFYVYQNKKTGEIISMSNLSDTNDLVNAVRSKGIYKILTEGFDADNEVEKEEEEEKVEDYILVIEGKDHYPYKFEKPFAAYLIPADIAVGERVFLEDVIEDYVKTIYGEVSYRLEQCEAIWNGKDLEIQFDPERDTTHTFL